MRHRHAAVPLVLVVAACGGGGPKVTLRYHPPAGAVYHYGVEQRTQVSADSGPLAKLGKRQMIMRLYFTQTVKGPTNGGTEVEVLFETMTMEIPGIPPSVLSSGLASIQGLRGTMVIDERGKVISSEFAPASGGSRDLAKRVAGGVNSMVFGFPEQSVGRGDSWTMTMELPLDQLPISASTSEVARTKLTVREIRVDGSDTSVVFDIKTEFPAEPIHLATSAGQSGTLKLEGGLAGHQLFSVSRGAILDGTIKGTTKMSFGGAMLGSSGMSMQTETENSIVLLPDR